MVKDETQKQVKSFAANNDMSMMEVVEYALKEYFEKAKQVFKEESI